MSLDTILHIGWTLGGLPLAWKAFTILSKLANQLEEYPLHRHVFVGGAELIEYPKGTETNVRRT